VSIAGPVLWLFRSEIPERLQQLDLTWA
jgi:hypothetical protein